MPSPNHMHNNEDYNKVSPSIVSYAKSNNLSWFSRFLFILILQPRFESWLKLNPANLQPSGLYRQSGSRPKFRI